MSGKKVVEETLRDGDLSKLVNQMIGLEDPDPEVVVPRYRRIHELTTKIVEMLEKLCTSPLGKTFGPIYPVSFGEIMKFVDTSKTCLSLLTLQENDKTFSGAELNAINADPRKLQALLMQADHTYKISGLGEKYNTLKTCPAVQNMIMLTRNIKTAVMLEKERRKTEHHDLEVKANLGDGFIVNADGETLELLPFSNLNFKSMMNSDRMIPELRQYTLYWLHLVYIKCMSIADDVTSPPIDIDKFSNLMIDSIGQLDAQVPRCREAFELIKNSVGLMKNNFRGYYKDFLSAGSPGIIVDHFIHDVMENTSASPTVAFQFQQIRNFYISRVRAHNIKDPRVKKMLALLGKNLDVLEDQPKSSSVKTPEKSPKPESVDNIPAEKNEDGETAPACETPQEGETPKVTKNIRSVPQSVPPKPTPLPAAADPQGSALKPVLKKRAAKKRP